MNIKQLIRLVIFCVFLFFQNVYGQREAYTQCFSTILGDKVFLLDSNHNYIDTFKIKEEQGNFAYLGRGLKCGQGCYYYNLKGKLWKLDENINEFYSIRDEDTSNYGNAGPSEMLLEIDENPYFFHSDNYVQAVKDLKNGNIIVDSSKSIAEIFFVRHCNGRDWIGVAHQNTIYNRVFEIVPNNILQEQKPVIFVFDGRQMMLNSNINYLNVLKQDEYESFQMDFNELANKLIVSCVRKSGPNVYVFDFSRKNGNLFNINEIYPHTFDTVPGVGVFDEFYFYDDNHILNLKDDGNPNLQELRFYKYNYYSGNTDSVFIPYKDFSFDSSYFGEYNLPSTLTALQFIPILHVNPNTFFKNRKVILQLRIHPQWIDSITGYLSMTTISEVYSIDLMDFHHPKLKRLFKSGIQVGSNIPFENYYDSLYFTFFNSDNKNDVGVQRIYSNLPSTPEAGFTYQINNYCQSNAYSVNFTDTSCCHFYRIWDYGDGTVSDTLWVTQHWELSGKIDSFRTVSHTYSHPGRYKVKLKILNPYNYGEHLPPGEFVMDSTEQWIEIPPCIEPGIGLRDTICVFDTLEVIYTGSENVDSLKLKVKPSGNVVKSIEKQSNGKVTFEEPGIYHIELEAKNAYYDTTWVYPDDIVVLDCDELWIPNAFTPNNDGTNDVFNYVCRNCVWHSLEIFNRDTQPIFRCEGSEACVWLGKTDKGSVPEGVYVYRLKVRKRDGRFVERVGTVTVMR